MTTKTSPHYKPMPTPDEYRLLVTKDGNKCVIKPCALDIIWGGDSRYWKIPEDNKTKPVELLQVSWLQVTGSVDHNLLPKDRTLRVKFNVKLKSDAFGWKNAPVYLMARVGKKYSWKKYDFSLLDKDKIVDVPQHPIIPVDAASSDDKIQFGMYEIWTGTWKGGLYIHDVVIEAV